MKYTTLPTTDLKISRICLGTMTWGNGQMGAEEEKNAHAQMDHALGAGVNFWDTAEMYAVPPRAETVGATETLMGAWFAKTGKRREVVLASKISPARKIIRDGAPLTPATLDLALEGSLKRLQTDYLDLYQFHWPTRPYPHHQNHWDFTPAADGAREVETMHAALQKMGGFIQAGKIRAFGLSNDTPWGVLTYLRLAEKFSLPRVASLQNEYSLIYRWQEADTAELCALENVGFLPYSPLAMGILTGKYQGGARPEGTRITLPGNNTVSRYSAGAEAATGAYIKLAAQAGVTPAQFALAFTLSRPFVTSTIVGATTLAQLKEDIAAIDVTLAPETLAEIEKLRRQYPVPY